MAGNGWRTIDSAPKDGTLLWTLWDGRNNKTGQPARYYAAAYYDSDADYANTWVNDSGDIIDEPTHWMPLPEPPDARGDQPDSDPPVSATFEA